MTGLWRDPENIFATGAIPKRLRKAWKQDFKAYKKEHLKTEINPSKILKTLCKSLRIESVQDELSRSGFESSGSVHTHCEIEFSIIIQTHYNQQYLKLKLLKHYDGKQLITDLHDTRFEQSIYLLNGGRPLLFGIVFANLDVTLPTNVIDVVALYLNPPKYMMDEMDEDDEERGYCLLLYSNDEKLQKENKMKSEWNGFFLNILTKWLSLEDGNEFDVHRFLQYLLSWFVSEKTQKCSVSMSKLEHFKASNKDH